MAKASKKLPKDFGGFIELLGVVEFISDNV